MNKQKQKKLLILTEDDLTAERMREIQHKYRTSIVDFVTDLDVYFEQAGMFFPVTDLGMYPIYEIHYQPSNPCHRMPTLMEFRIYYKIGRAELYEVADLDSFGI